MKRLLLLFLGVALALLAIESADARTAAQGPVVVAVIVNPKNPTTNLTSAQLSSYFRLEQQFWSNKQRCAFFLRPSNSPEMEVLLDRIYRMSNSALRRYWVGKVFRGEIAAKPSVIPTSAAAGARVRKVVGALTVVLSTEIPDGVRVLTVDGKKPGDAGYALVAERSPEGLP